MGTPPRTLQRPLLPPTTNNHTHHHRDHDPLLPKNPAPAVGAGPARDTNPTKKEKGRHEQPFPSTPYSLNPYSLSAFILIVPTPQRQKGRAAAGKAPEGNNIATTARFYRKTRHLR